MSEYQYYDFYAIDKPLTQKQIETISTFSSRTHPTPRRASFVYHYGDFGRNQEEVVGSYFDMMLYVANWGTRQLLMKFPANMVPFKTLQRYDIDASDFSSQEIRVFKKDNWVFINLEINIEEGEWIEGEGLLDTLLPLREQILFGDYRVLYLAWKYLEAKKRTSENYEDEDYEEEDYEDEELLSIISPPIPSNLGKTNSALQYFISFWEIDADLVDSTVAESPTEDPIPEGELILLIKDLSDEQKDQLLTSLLRDRLRAQLDLKNRLKELYKDKPA
ncbi:MAG: hypothetical protein AAGC85_07050 [Bacteroidota bacterium]